MPDRQQHILALRHNAQESSSTVLYLINELNQAQSEYKHSLTFRIQRYVVRATKAVHRLQIRPIAHNYRAPLPYHSCKLHPVRAVVWKCDKGQTHRRVTNKQQTVTVVYLIQCSQRCYSTFASNFATC